MEKEDRNLIEKAQQGNISAFEELVQKYDRRIKKLSKGIFQPLKSLSRNMIEGS